MEYLAIHNTSLVEWSHTKGRKIGKVIFAYVSLQTISSIIIVD